MKKLSVRDVIEDVDKEWKKCYRYVVNVKTKATIGEVPPAWFTDGKIFSYRGKQYLYIISDRERFSLMLAVTWQVESIILPTGDNHLIEEYDPEKDPECGE